MPHQDHFIHSIKEEAVIEARSLQTAKGRLALQKCLLEGKEQIGWALDSPCKLLCIFIHDKLQQDPFTQALREKEIPISFASEGILKKITDTNFLVPYIGVAAFPPLSFQPVREFLVVLDGVKDFGDVGAIIRTAQGFGISSFASTQSDMDLFYKKTIDASRGLVFKSALDRYSSPLEAVRALKKSGYQIAATTPHESVMQSFAELKAAPIALVLGNETSGVSAEILQEADIKIQIPMSRDVESLNVAVACGISLYEIKIKWILAMLTHKIQNSLGSHLYSASQWIRQIFDHKLRASSPLNADQGIMLMILKCDGSSTRERLSRDAGIKAPPDSLIDPLISGGFMKEKGGALLITEKGEEALAKIWALHEVTESIAFKHVSAQDKETFLKVLQKMMQAFSEEAPYQ